MTSNCDKQNVKITANEVLSDYFFIVDLNSNDRLRVKYRADLQLVTRRWGGSLRILKDLLGLYIDSYDHVYVSIYVLL